MDPHNYHFSFTLWQEDEDEGICSPRIDVFKECVTIGRHFSDGGLFDQCLKKHVFDGLMYSTCVYSNINVPF